MGLVLRERIAPAKANLAATAALEHFTATLAELVLTDEATREQFGHPAVRELFVWHAHEESEHKAVAFDVYKAVGGTERMRVWTMNALRYGFVIGMFFQVSASLLFDKATYKPAKPAKELQEVPPVEGRQPRDLGPAEGLQPSRLPPRRPRHDRKLVAKWREELFGTEGTLNDKLVRSAVA